MLSSLALQDVTVDVVVQRASAVYSAIADVQQVSTAGLIACSTVITSTVIDYPTLAANDFAITIVASALSSVLEKANLLPPKVYRNVSTALDSLSKALHYAAAVNEAAFTLTTSTFSLSCQVSYAGDAGSTSYSAAQTSEQLYTGSSSQGLALNVGGDSFNSIGVSMVVYAIGVHSNRSTSKASYKLNLVYFDNPTTTTYVSVFTNPTPVDYAQSYEGTNHTYACEKRDHRGNSYQVTVACAGANVTFTCPGSKATMSYTCPGLHLNPTCKSWDDVSSSFQPNPDCEVISYNNYNTTCRCTSSASRRNLATSSSSSQQSVELGASVDVVISTFVNTWKTAATLNAETVAKNWVILTISTCITALIIIGFIGMLLKYDKPAKANEKSKKKKRTTIRQFFDDVLPEEFRDRPWFILYWDRMLAKHKYISFLSPIYKSPNKRCYRLVVVLGRIINVLFFDTIISSLVFDNSGFCAGYTSEVDCLKPLNLDMEDHLCSWNSENFSCSFNPPPSTFVSGLIVCLLCVVLAVPLDIIVERMAAYCIIDTRNQLEKERDRKLQLVKASQSMSIHPSNVEDYDDNELSNIQTKKSKLMLAARLRHMQLEMDNKGPKEELEFMLLHADKMTVSPDHPELHDTLQLVKAFRRGSFAGKINQIVVEETIAQGHGNPKIKDMAVDGKLLKRIRQARKKAADFKADLDQLESDDLKQKFLIRRLIVGSLSGFRNTIAHRYFFDPIEIETDERQRRQRQFSLIALPAYLMTMLFFVFLYGVSLGPHTTYVWLASLALNLLQDIFLIQPLIIFLNFTLLSSLIREEVGALHKIIYKRAKVVMRRTRGLFSNGSSLIQHINPACRVARKFPELTVSRLLMMLNDYDFPSYRKQPPKKHPILAAVLGVLGAIGMALILLFTFLPEPVQETLINLVAGGGVSFIFLRIAILDVVAIVVIVVLGFFIIALLVAYEWRIYRSYQRTTNYAKSDEFDMSAIPAYNTRLKPVNRAVLYKAGDQVAVADDIQDNDLDKLANFESKTIPTPTIDPQSKRNSIAVTGDNLNEEQLQNENDILSVEEIKEKEVKEEEEKTDIEVDAPLILATTNETQDDDDNNNDSINENNLLPAQTQTAVPNNPNFCTKYDIPIISGPPIAAGVYSKNQVDDVSGAAEHKQRSTIWNPESGDTIGILRHQRPPHPRHRRNRKQDKYDSLMMGGKMPVMEGPGARARRQMDLELHQDLSREGTHLEADEKTVREVVSADPFQTNYTYGDLYQALSAECDDEQRALTLARHRESDRGIQGVGGHGLAPRTSPFRYRPPKSNQPNPPMWT